MNRAVPLAVLLVVALLAAPAPAPPRIGGCPVFPASNAWNRDVSRAPVDPRSDAYVRSIDGSTSSRPCRDGRSRSSAAVRCAAGERDRSRLNA
jgi:hypothetical protein